jgi:hypothetical protein
MLSVVAPTMTLHWFEAKQQSLKLKTLPKKLLGFLPLDILSSPHSCSLLHWLNLIFQPLSSSITSIQNDVNHQLSPDQLVDGGLPVEQKLQEGPEAFTGKHLATMIYNFFLRNLHTSPII